MVINEESCESKIRLTLTMTTIVFLCETPFSAISSHYCNTPYLPPSQGEGAFTSDNLGENPDCF